MTTLSLRTWRSRWAYLIVTTALGLLAGPLAANAPAASSTPVSGVRAEPPGQALAQDVETVYDLVVYAGTSAGVVAAVQAFDEGVSVQRVDGVKFRQRLVSDRQVLEWKGQRRSG